MGASAGSLAVDLFGEKTPGKYKVTCTRLSVTLGPQHSSKELTVLHNGDVVYLHEVAGQLDDGRLRGRIASPEGWVTLAHFIGSSHMAFVERECDKWEVVTTQNGHNIRCCPSMSSEIVRQCRPGDFISGVQQGEWVCVGGGAREGYSLIEHQGCTFLRKSDGHPWRVVTTKSAHNVRHRPNLASPILKQHAPGTILCGFQQGNWLCLEGELGYALIRNTDGVFLQRVSEEPPQTSSKGTAAQLLGFDRQTAMMLGYVLPKVRSTADLLGFDRSTESMFGYASRPVPAAVTSAERATSETEALKRFKCAHENKEAAVKLFRGGEYRSAISRFNLVQESLSCQEGLTGAVAKQAAALFRSVAQSEVACHLKLQDWNGAIKTCEGALAEDPKNEQLLFFRALAWVKVQDYVRAKSDLTRLLAINQQHTEASRMLDECRHAAKTLSKEQRAAFAQTLSSTRGMRAKAGA